jgi:prevent-host-death family protein
MEPEDIGAFDAKTRLSELLDNVEQGHTYRITKRGRPVAELRPLSAPRGLRTFGDERGRIVIADSFDDPIDDFEGYR